MLRNTAAYMLPTKPPVDSQCASPTLVESGTWGAHFFTTPAPGYINPVVCLVCFPFTPQEVDQVTSSDTFDAKKMLFPYPSAPHKFCYLVQPTLANQSNWYAHHYWGNLDERRDLTPPYNYYHSAKRVSAAKIRAKVALWRQYATIKIKPWVEEKHLNWFFKQMAAHRELAYGVPGAWYSVDDPQTNHYLGLLSQIFQHPALFFKLRNLTEAPLHCCFVSREETFKYKAALRIATLPYCQGDNNFSHDLSETILEYLPITEPLHFVHLWYAKKAKGFQREHALSHCPMSLGLAMHAVSKPTSMGVFSVYNLANLASINQLVYDTTLLAIGPTTEPTLKYRAGRTPDPLPVSFFMQVAAEAFDKLEELWRTHRSSSQFVAESEPEVAHCVLDRAISDPSLLRASALACFANLHDMFTYFGTAGYEDQDEIDAPQASIEDTEDKPSYIFDCFDFRYCFSRAWYPSILPNHEKSALPLIQVQVDEDLKQIESILAYLDEFQQRFVVRFQLDFHVY